MNTDNGSMKHGWKRAVVEPMVVGLLLLLYAWMGLSAVRDKSTTFDEMPHITGGYSYWLRGDYRIHSGNGNLSQRWASLPLLFTAYRFPLETHQSWQQAQWWLLGYDFFYKMGNDLQGMLFRSRIMIAVAGMALGVMVYIWSRALFGSAGGLLSLVLYCFSPTMLAHGTLATSDLMVTLGFIVSLWCLWRLFSRVTVATLLLAGVATGGLLLAKMSGLLILPMSIALIVIRLCDRRPLVVAIGNERRIRTRASLLGMTMLALLLHFLIAAGVVWTAYGFRYSVFHPASAAGAALEEPWSDVLAGAGSLAGSIERLRQHHILPEAYLYGISFVLARSRVRSAFLNGQWSVEGWWYFFPYSFLVKTPLPLFGLLGCAIMGFIYSFWYRQQGPPDGSRAGGKFILSAPLWVLLTVYWATALTSHLNLGHRHLLPTYPPLFILAGAGAIWLTAKTRAMLVVVLAGVVWFAAESLAIRPHYLAYFNQVAGGPSRAYTHLVDSSLDWGQDLPGVRRWLDQHPTSSRGTPVYLSYFGTGDPRYYNIQATALPSYLFDLRLYPARELAPLRGGVYIISATMLQNVCLPFRGEWTPAYEREYQQLRVAFQRDVPANAMQIAGDTSGLADAIDQMEQLRFARLLAFLRRRTPDDMIGYSILIYHLSDEQVRRALDAPL